ncbi:hypothetical protein QQ045_006028 [Rhodiola kirilowii]
MENASSTTVPIFSCGMELASFVVASDVLTQSWETIASLNVSNGGSATYNGCVRINVSDKPNCTIIAFVVTPQIENLEGLEGAKDLVSSDTLDKKKFPFIDLLCHKTIKSFSIHKLAGNAFESVFEDMDTLYTQCLGGSKPLIITGHSLGGSVASLFTLWLLGRINPASTKLPICITFGVPLIGDDRLLKAISQRSIWDSCFVHVVGELDPVPRFLAATSSSVYKPFGTYMLTSESGCACFNDPESVIVLLKATHLMNPGNSSLEYYCQVVANLRRNIVVNGVSRGNEEWILRPQNVGIAMQLDAIGISRSRPWHQNTDIERLHSILERRELMARINTDKKKALDPSKKLNDMKINMAKLEWYKKKTQEEETGYYDSYKNAGKTRDIEVTKFKTQLTKYWIDIVAKAEQKPQAVGRVLPTRYIFAGTNYRRMVEPLDIADWVKDPKHRGVDYIANRPEHYTRLEEWLDAERVVGENAHGTSAPNLTEDSCFWARVEKAISWCSSLSKVGSEQEAFTLRHNIGAFDNYVMSLLKEKTVSSDIFLSRSSFMQWWREYEAILNPNENTEFTGFMRSRQYVNYK